MNRIDRYLNEVSWAMGGRFSEQQAARDELRAHIRDQVHDLRLAGLDEESAIEQALRELGDPGVLGRSLRSSRGTAALRRGLVQPAGALILERRSDRRMPPPGMLLALAALAATTVAATIIYVWP